MWYNDLRPYYELKTNKYSRIFYEKKYQKFLEEDKKRTIYNLVRLKRGILKNIPKKEVDRNILLASWNIKELGHTINRLPESFFYIAEIINAFDIIAIQEIKSTLNDLKIIMSLLGSNWKYLITDITEGSAGNSERFGIIYDTRRVEHSGLSGELVIPKQYSGNNKKDILQLKRTPSITGFESGWKKFSIINIHLHPGEGKNNQGIYDRDIRKKEVFYLMKLLKQKLKDKHLWNENLILLGDTNLYKEDKGIVDLITDVGFKESNGLFNKPTNVSLNQIYDRIFLKTNNYFKFMKDECGLEKGGVFKFFKYVFRCQDRENYHKLMKCHKTDPSNLVDDSSFDNYFHRYWKRNQISDHLPIWIEIKKDSSIDFLKKKSRSL